jgi:ATP-dependent Clp protease ATP-binding subunit ClpA
MSNTVTIKLKDLLSSARAGKLNDVVGREAEMKRLVRMLLRPSRHHIALVGEPGVGKTSLVEALALRLYQGKLLSTTPKIFALNTTPILALLVGGDSLNECLDALRNAVSQLDSAIIVVEDIQLLAADDPNRLELTIALLEALSSNTAIRLIVTTTISSHQRIFADDYRFGRSFDALHVGEADNAGVLAMIEQARPRLERANHQVISAEAVEQAVYYGGRYGHGRALPDAALRLLEETCVMASLEGYDEVGATEVKAVVSERERLPLAGLETDQKDRLATLETRLLKAVVGQPAPLRTIARNLARAQLGLGDASRPRGSFLLLGPSGVGKTETAKALVAEVFTNPAALVRLDMSEYSEAHSAVRLIGSPPGYIGYESGGQLTGAVAREPYSLVLLDEIEKAHTKLFDLFLQVLDDGRLTDSSGKTVSFTETIVLATSNTGAAEIGEAHRRGMDIHSANFMQDTLLPILMQNFRPEFLNRFDAILVYQPLGNPELIALAQRELARLSARLEHLGIGFKVSDEVLAGLLLPNYNPLFGARPVKRFIAAHFETPVADRLIRRELTGPLTITGTEPWLTTGAAV